MKKRTVLIFTLISIIAMVAGTAMTSNAPRSIRYLGSLFITGKGAVFHFETTGEFTQKDMKTAFAYGNGGDPLNVHCVVQAEKSRIACTVKNVNKYSDVMLSIMGQGFWATVPRQQCSGFTVILPDTDFDQGVQTYSWAWFGGDLKKFGFDSEGDFFAFYETLGFVFPDKCLPPGFEYEPFEVPV